MATTDQELLRQAGRALKVGTLRKIASGGQKLVYSGKRDGRDVVLKVAKVLASPDPVALERAHREVELLEAIDHPNVVRALSPAVDIGNPVEAVCWVEEPLAGDDLWKLLDPRWQPPAIEELMLDVSRGLDALHSVGVVHRDLSPGNVFRTPRGFVILDPGFAKHLDRTSITGLGQPGTPGYKSPEHVDIDNGPCPASDVFMLGVLAFRCATGRLPIDVHDRRGYLPALRDGQAPPVGSLVTIPNELAAVIDRCLQRQLARRYFDAAAVIKALGGT